MEDKDQLTRHEREIGELRGKLDSLATKEYVREVVQEQTRDLHSQMNPRFDDINAKFDAVNSKLDALSEDVRNLNAKQQRITGAADLIKTVLPLLISIATLIVLNISLLANFGS